MKEAPTDVNDYFNDTFNNTFNDTFNDTFDKRKYRVT